jgi:hypothetical protein
MVFAGRLFRLPAFEIRGRALRMFCLPISCLAIIFSTRTVLYNDPLLSARVAEVVSAFRPWKGISLDAPLPAIVTEAAALTPAEKSRVLLVLLDSCSQCSVSRLIATDQLASVMAKKGYRVVVFTQDSQPKLAETLEKYGSPHFCSVFADPSGIVSRALGTSRFPQFAEFVDGRAVYVQHTDGFLNRIVLDWLQQKGWDEEIAALRKAALPEQRGKLSTSKDVPCPTK